MSENDGGDDCDDGGDDDDDDDDDGGGGGDDDHDYGGDDDDDGGGGGGDDGDDGDDDDDCDGNDDGGGLAQLNVKAQFAWPWIVFARATQSTPHLAVFCTAAIWVGSWRSSNIVQMLQSWCETWCAGARANVTSLSSLISLSKNCE